MSCIYSSVWFFQSFDYSWKYAAAEFPVGNYMFKINNRNTRTRCQICSVTIKDTKTWRRFGVFTVTLTIFYTLF